MATRRAEDHRTEQAALGSLIAGLIAHAWATLLDPHDLKGSTPKLTVAVEAIVKHYGAASASHALTAYRQQRLEAGVDGAVPRLPMPAPPSHEELAAKVESVLHNLYGAVTPALEQKTQDALTSEVEQLVLDQGRRATMGAAQSDKEAKGWARVVEPGACSFCLMLAARGGVYTSRKTANFRAHTKKPDGSGGTCRCNVEPVFNAYEPSAEIRHWQQVWDNQIAGKFSGRDARVAFRQAVEGRPVTGPLTKEYHHGDGVTPGRKSDVTHDPSRDVDAEATTAQLEDTLAKLERSLAKFESAGTRARVEELRRKIALRK